MASAPKTVGFNTALSKGKVTSGGSSRIINRKRFLKWVGTSAPKGLNQVRAENWDRMKRKKPLALLNRKVGNTIHNNDMYRIAGGPVVVVGRDNTRFGKINKKTGRPEYNRGRNLRAPVVAQDRPRISFVKGPNGKIISESKAQTLASAKPVNRPFGRPQDQTPNKNKPNPNARPAVDSANFGEWKDSATSYNAALSRQQQFDTLRTGGENTVLQSIKPIKIPRGSRPNNR